ncbi:hypothetical protein BKA70DRAFT_1142953 [Coprinopsis sp. MPI-PUGE-AT-0042]|nr:hypothetical protein BKA70DRAFT_1142953 [Coprinopsis sp. MPI-PUGE-AT-0042]
MSSTSNGHVVPALKLNSASLQGPHVGSGQASPRTSTRPGTTPMSPRSSTQPSHSRPRTASGKDSSQPNEAKWGSNFWVTLVDPQTQTSFYACPATGQVSWDPPAGHFVLPPSNEGEWWELADDSRGGMPYYYHTKTGETVWEKPSAFVIPLGILQNTALARRLSQIDRTSKNLSAIPVDQSPGDKPSLQQSSRAYGQRHSVRRSVSEQHGSRLEPIPQSPYVTENSAPPSPSSSKFKLGVDDFTRSGSSSKAKKEGSHAKTSRSRSSTVTSHRLQAPQSLDAALEKINVPQSENGVPTSPSFKDSGYLSESTRSHRSGSTPSHSPPASPQITASRPMASPLATGPTVGGKPISSPILNHAATLQMSPVKNRASSRPIAVVPKINIGHSDSIPSRTSLSSGSHPVLPQDLVSDIQLFSESEYAKQYFSTHRSGFIFKRKIPMEQLMTWQKAPLTAPLLVLNRTLHKDAVKVFKIIQFIMGDREREKPAGMRLQSEVPSAGHGNGTSASLANPSGPLLDQQRWVVGEGLTHGELRDEIYCQLMKQLTGNPSPESVFRGWQFLCVLLLTFPPSKDFETYLQAFIQKHSAHQEGRIDVIAKYCLRRLSAISQKGPRGKPPSIQEIETASDAAFNPSTFGESLDAIVRLQERNYPHQKVPIILPFLADGILALGGPRVEGIFRVPGDSDSVSELKLRIDRGYYTLDSMDDPHVLASLLKLWLRELCDPVVPSEMYNECIMGAQDPDVCVSIIHRLPTINRRVLLFVVSFMQIFLDEKTQSITKMTPANLALVMAPNLLRCTSDSMSVVFTNAQYEQIFVYNLLLHLRCDEVDPSYRPVHGLGAASRGKSGQSRTR